jgi:hypothetical protein
MAILSFKKKSKGELGGLSSSMDDMNLESENLTLKDLSSSVGSLKDPSRGKNNGEPLDADIYMAGGPRNEGSKLQDLEASVNDLKKHAESTDMNGKATRGDLDNMKKDLSQINDSIKSLLNIYEAVSRQYNPFVEKDLPIQSFKDPEPEEPLGLLGPQKGVNIPSPGPAAYDDEGPLDRIVKPDQEDIYDKIVPPVPQHVPLPIMPSPVQEEVEEELPAPKRYEPTEAALPMDSFALDHFHRLVEYQLNKVYKAKLMGVSMDQAELDNLDRWLKEFKRFGGS